MSATQVTVTAVLQDPSGTAIQGNAYLRFRLRNFAGFVPQVSGNSIFVETIIDALPDSSGNISQLLWPNSNILPATTFWTVELWNNGRITSSGNYIFNGNTSLNTAAQLNAPPVPPGFQLVLLNNGTPNSSQSTLNLESSDNSIIITDEGGGAINLQSSGSISASQVPFMLGPGILNLINVAPNAQATWMDTALQVGLCQFILPVGISGLTKLDGSFWSNLSGGSNLVVGFYSVATQALLWSSGVLNVPNESNTAISFTVPSLTLPPGSYYMAWSSADNGNAATFGWASPITLSYHSGTSNGNVVNQSTVSFGVAVNPATSGPTLPATLGGTVAFAATNGFAVPAILFH